MIMTVSPSLDGHLLRGNNSGEGGDSFIENNGFSRISRIRTLLRGAPFPSRRNPCGCRLETSLGTRNDIKQL